MNTTHIDLVPGEFRIDLVLGTAAITKVPYKLAPLETKQEHEMHLSEVLETLVSGESCKAHSHLSIARNLNG